MTLVDRVGRRLRTGRRACRTVILRLRFSDYTRASRSYTMAEAATDTWTLLSAAHRLLGLAQPMIESRGLTLIGVALVNLEPSQGTQLALPFTRPPELDITLDRIRDRFGSSAITRGMLVGRDPGPWVPLLPD